MGDLGSYWVSDLGLGFRALGFGTGTCCRPLDP